jgi:hypothetical protein
MAVGNENIQRLSDLKWKDFRASFHENQPKFL